jgi:hypothetical protein
MKVVKSLLLGSAAGLLTVAGAQAADLPTRKAAPVEYVRICDAYGAGFFYIPGTDTCLKVGGLALFEARVFNTPYSIGAGFFSAAAPGALAAGLGTPPFFVPGGGVTLATAYRNARERDNYGLGALGRIELDARTQTGYGTLRAFIRVARPRRRVRSTTSTTLQLVRSRRRNRRSSTRRSSSSLA